ncbi:MAG: DUF4236 domain-containing protein [Acidobacteriota bacterium]
MSFRFWRRIRIAPGVTLNLSKSSGSLSFGPRGAKLTVGPRGSRATLGIPGTGLFYTTTAPNRSARRASAPVLRPQDRLEMGFFKRLVTPEEETALVDGLRQLALGNEAGAYKHLQEATHLADGAYLAGFLALKRQRLEKAADYLKRAAEKHSRLGRHLSRYGISALLSLPITDEVLAHVGPTLRGVLLGLVEAYQRLGRKRDALACLERLRRLEPDDVVVRLSLAELLLDSQPPQEACCRQVVRLGKGLRNETPVHAALMLYKARALRGLGLREAAREVLTAALRRKKDRSPQLLRALRYERARIYQELGQASRARGEFGKLYAEAPDYQDVAERLEL